MSPMLTRRQMLRSAAAVAVGFAGLRSAVGRPQATTRPARFGPLLADPAGLFDLPDGFAYTVLSHTGDEMDDGLLVPGHPDGMAAFPAPDGKVLVVRNHECDGSAANADGAFGKRLERLDKADPAKVYDNGTGRGPAFGGTSTFLYDPTTRRLERQWMSLAGTARNCAGGPTPWGSWVTCEESVAGPNDALEGERPRFARWHGYNFEVPATPDGTLTPAVPLTAMGRFNHEAIAVDPRTGIVYQTEDRPDGLIYRFLPNVPGRLAEGGRLQALRAVDRSRLDTRNWEGRAVRVGERFACAWADVDDVESRDDSLRKRGFAAGCCRFARAEGMWFGVQRGRGGIYFACTNGGAKKKGQIWRYTPAAHEGTPGESESPGTLELFVEPDDGAIVDNADNLCVAPWGELFVCEDNAGPERRLLCVGPDGTVSVFGRNAVNQSELAGVCFSPDGSTLFVNIQHQPGLTLAITGPWREG